MCVRVCAGNSVGTNWGGRGDDTHLTTIFLMAEAVAVAMLPTLIFYLFIGLCLDEQTFPSSSREYYIVHMTQAGAVIIYHSSVRAD